MKKILHKLIKTQDELESIVVSKIQGNYGGNITYLNQHGFNIATIDSKYYNLLVDDFIVYPDGIGIRLAARHILNSKLKKYNATDLNYDLIDLFEMSKFRYFFIGGNFDNLFVNRFMDRKDFFSGYHRGYNFEEKELIDSIKSARPDVILIGMGIPKQEKLAERLSKQFDGTLIICVGNFLEFYFGTIPRAPQIFRNSGFEWVFRLITEPKRLWKRYLIGIPLFIFRVLKEKYKK